VRVPDLLPGAAGRRGGGAVTELDLRALLDLPFTDEQLAAATAPLAPELIVAGAGTGKTAVMAARVVWLVATGQVSAGAVLGLTFTNKAAGELAHRVHCALRRAGLGDDGAEPTVSTYHSYAGRLIVEHGLRLGVEPTVRLLTEAARFQLVERVLADCPPPLPTLTAPVWLLVDRIAHLEASLSEHLVDSDELRRFDRALIAAVDQRQPRVELQKLADCCRQRLDLTTVAAAVRTAKRAAEVVDFADQTALAAELAERFADVGEVERRRFAVVLLDEYQDTSVGQRRMLTALFGGGHPVSAVGDPGQSIYGWRGASAANLPAFPTHFPRADGAPARSYPLSANHRSGDAVLSVANRLSAPLRGDRQPPLHALDPQTPSRVECALLPTADDETGWLADRVAAAVAAGTPPAECAVLVRAAADIPPLRTALTARGVPVEVVGLTGLLALPEIADLVAVLRLIEDPTSNAALVRLLTGPRWRIGPRDLAALGRAAAAAARTAPGPDPDPDHAAAGDPADLARTVSPPDSVDVVSLAEALDGPVPGASPDALARFRRLAAELRGLAAHARDPVPDLIGHIVTVTGLDVEVAASAEAVRAGRRRSLGSFQHLAAEFVAVDGSVSLAAFLGYLDAAEEYDRGLDAGTPSGQDAVQLSTVHKAKGLEWTVVALPNLCTGTFPLTRVRDRWTGCPDELPYPLRGDADALPVLPDLDRAGLAAFSQACAERLAAEERRLGYVAVTRARSLLLVSGHWWSRSAQRPRGPSPFLLEAHAACTAGAGEVVHWAPAPADGERNPLLEQRVEVPWPAEPDPTAAARRPWAADAALVASWDRDMAALVDEATRRDRGVEPAVPEVVTTSQLMQLAADPNRFAATLRRPMPRRPVPAARLGTRFHAWLQAQYGARPLLGPDELPGAADGDEIAGEDDLRRLRAAFARTPYAERRPLDVEVPFQLSLAGHLVTGRIDAVFREHGHDEVVDWKTGDAGADPLQLAVYRLAWARLARVPATRVTAAFVHVRTGAVERFTDLPGEAELTALLAGSAGGRVGV
jgi:DNA helicase-2/ATP-dependent DNA helicase PcrA